MPCFSFSCAGTSFSAKNPLVIAEIGTAHGGSLEKAKALIHAAADSGADCVKFQWVYADEILHPNTGSVPLPGGAIRLYDTFKKLEVPISFFSAVKEECEKNRCFFLCSPFGPRSAAELISLQPAALKIASPELNYVQLLRQCAASGLPLIVSTGVSQFEDIAAAVAATEESPSRIILHCVTCYPAPETDYNVSVIPHIASTFHLPVGISDHSKDPLIVPLTALAHGAVAIEKHITLSRSGSGLDDPVALEPADFKKMTKELREAARIVHEDGGSGVLFEMLNKRFGKSLIAAVSGNGKKQLAPSESANYGRTNRSLHTRETIRQGDTFTPENTAILRTEKILRPGLPPAKYDRIIGKTAAHDIPAGEGIRAEDIS